MPVGPFVFFLKHCPQGFRRGVERKCDLKFVGLPGVANVSSGVDGRFWETLASLFGQVLNDSLKVFRCDLFQSHEHRLYEIDLEGSREETERTEDTG